VGTGPLAEAVGSGSLTKVTTIGRADLLVDRRKPSAAAGAAGGLCGTWRHRCCALLWSAALRPGIQGQSPQAVHSPRPLHLRVLSARAARHRAWFRCTAAQERSGSCAQFYRALISARGVHSARFSAAGSTPRIAAQMPHPRAEPGLVAPCRTGGSGALTGPQQADPDREAALRLIWWRLGDS